MDLTVMLALLLVQAPAHLFSTEQRAFRVPSSFLKPPPILRAYKSSTGPPVAVSQSKAFPVVQRATRHQSSKLLQSKEFWQQPKQHISAAQSQLLPTQHDYSSYYDLKCNPCNRVPWIPVIGYVYPNEAPQQPSHHVNIPYTPYYHPINDLSSNLVRPASAATPTFPLYVAPPLYQQYSPQAHHNSLWPSANLPNHNVVTVPEMHPVQETVHENPLAPFYSSSEPSPPNVGGFGLSHWVNEAQPVPVFHYEHTIDYPSQHVHSPALDIPHRIPQPHSIPLAPYPSALAGPTFSTPSSDSLLDLSNHLEDSKYSSSEDKFSFTSNTTAKDGKGLRAYTGGEGGNVSDIIEYLTPPSSAISGHAWLETPSHADEEVLLKPLEDWAFIKEIEPKSEKRKKQIQIVIPYTMNKSKHMAKTLKENASSSSSSSNTKWYLTTNITTTTMLPLINYLKGNFGGGSAGKNIRPTPSESTDWQKLRKAIDSWTEERFSNHKYNSSIHFDMGLSTLPPSKEIPKDFLRSSLIYRENKKEKFAIDQMQNRVSSGIKDSGSDTATTQKNWPSWKVSPSVSPSSSSTSSSTTAKGKVYIVTPLPLTNYSFSSNGIDTENWTFL